MWLWVFIPPEVLPTEQLSSRYKNLQDITYTHASTCMPRTLNKTVGQLITQKRSMDWGVTTHFFVYINLLNVCTMLLVRTSPGNVCSINQWQTVATLHTHTHTHTHTHIYSCKSRPLKAKFMNALSSWRHGQNLRAVLFGKADEELLF